MPCRNAHDGREIISHDIWRSAIFALQIITFARRHNFMRRAFLPFHCEPSKYRAPSAHCSVHSAHTRIGISKAIFQYRSFMKCFGGSERKYEMQSYEQNVKITILTRFFLFHLNRKCKCIKR